MSRCLGKKPPRAVLLQKVTTLSQTDTGADTYDFKIFLENTQQVIKILELGFFHNQEFSVKKY